MEQDTPKTTDDKAREELERITAGLDKVLEVMNKIGVAIAEFEEECRNEKSITLATLGVTLFAMKERYDTLDKSVKRVYHFADLLNKFVIPERLRELDLEGFRVPEIARSFSVVEKTSASFIDKEKGLEWLREIGQGDMIQETVNAQTLSTFCRNMLLEEGREPPPELVKTSVYNTTSMTKYRPK